MAAYLHIENFRVVNVIEVDPAQFPDWTLRPALEGVGIGWLWDGNDGYTPAPPPALDREAAAAHIDSTVATIYARFLRFQPEYEAREAQALAYKNAGYTGAVPSQVQAFATPAGITASAATDVILQQAGEIRAALEELGVLRMRKYEILRAANDADARAAQAQIEAAVAVIDGNLK